MSGEHPLSKASLKGRDVFIKGLPSCNGQTVVIPRSKFKSNILCRAHNNSLSTVDEAGVKGIEALEKALSNARERNKVQGTLFERWLLKTLINLELLADFNRRPSQDVVEIAFGMRAFGSNAGLFVIGDIGESVPPNAGFQYVQLYRSDLQRTPAICGGRFSVRGFSFLLTFCNLVPDEALRLALSDGSLKTVFPRPRPHRSYFSSQPSSFIDFSW